MKKLLLITLVLFATTTKATNYYFSAISGDDSRTSAQAKSSATPWKTLSKLNSFFSSLQPGDSVLLKRGETFYGSITVNKSGTSGSPIVISAYGTGNKPIITGLTTLTGWVSTGNGIYESYNSLLGTDVNVVLLNNATQQMGRYPNVDAANGGYLNFESHVGTTSITDKELTSSTNWTGAEVVIRVRHWVINKCPITAHSGSTITYSGSTQYSPYNNYGYFIQNSLKTLDKFGEWYYNPSTKKLSVYFGSSTPGSYTIQASAISNLISSSSFSYIVFDNLTVKGADGNGFDVKYGSGCYIKNCDIMNSGGNGITLSSQPNCKIENCTVTNSGNNGIDLGTSGNNAIVRNNIITNTASVPGMGQNGDTKGLGINTNGSGSLIEYNEVINTGYIGINFSGDDVTIKNNLVDTFCRVKDDGAGIYTYIGTGAERTGRKVIGNIVLNAMGADFGTDRLGYFPAEGIYLDDRSANVEINDNTIANGGNNGLFLHNAYNITMKNNTFYNNVAQMYAGQDAGSALIRNLVVTSNVFFSRKASQLTSYIKSSADDINLFGKFDSNYYARPIDDRLAISAGGHKLELEGWKDQYHLDANSKRSAKEIAPYKLNNIIGANKFSNGSLTTSVSGVAPTSCAVSLNTTMLDAGCLQVVPTAKASSVSMSIGSITAGKNYLLKFSVRGSVDSTQSLGAYLRMNLSPYSNLTSIQTRKIYITRSENEMLFTAPSTQSSVSVVFYVDDQTKYYLDNVQVYEADASVTNVDDSLKFVYNASNASKTITLGGNYVDVKNVKYSNSIVLKPYTSAVLTKTSTSVTNVAPTVAITSPANNASFNAPASVTINATAADADGSVAKVEFYNGTTLLGSDATSPYLYSWTNVAKGNYTITAKATDNGGLVTSSSAVAITVVTPNVAPTVAVTSPVNNASFNAPASVTINATAADADGSVSKVEFYNGTTLLGSDATSPYSYLWTNVAKGNYTITAKATDNGGLVTSSSSVAITVVTPNVAPTVAVTSPVNNASFNAPASVTINATAADADGSVTKVDFYNGTTLLGSDASSPYSFTWNNVAAGNYAITAKATDNGGLVTSSSAVTITATTPNVAPTVSVTSPVNSASFNAPASVTINATAADADGSVSKVEFYNGNTLLGSDATSPYSYSWTNVPKGNYTITAKATDNGGLVTSSSLVAITVVTPNVAPTVSVTSPASNASFNAPASVTINATAADADGSVTKVDFYNGNTLLGSDASSPYSFTWNNVAAGNYAITAKATDNGGLVTSSSAVTMTAITPNVAPTVSVTSPVNSASFNSPASITISATAADADGSVTKVEFYNGNTLLNSDATSPYSFTWNNVAAGNYAITAKATDNGGLVTSSAAVTLTVITPNVAPTVSVTSPVNSASFNSPASITISATAADADGSVTKVEFYNGNTLLNSDATSPYSFTWNNVAAGNYAITAKATDNGGLVTSSAAVTLTVITPNVAPTVTLTSPVNNASFNAPASVTINATAADADGSVTKVDFYNGNTLLGSDASSPYSFTWNNVAAGNYAITAKATDNGGLVTSSSAVTMTAITPNVAPTVSLTSPANNASFNAPASVTINATAADADGSVTKVEFYNGTTLLGSDASSPYSFTWNNVAAGNYAITAKATDNGGLVTSSSAVTITATTPNVAPTVSLTSPANNASFNAPASVTINATAADADGSVTKVEFYNGTTLLGSDASSPYSFTWNNVAAGNYAITAKATDNGGLVTSSSAVTITAITPNVAPTISVTSPVNNASFNAPASVTISATAADADGSVTKVDFYNGSTLLGSDATSPYSFTWNNVAAGNYAITAKATDNGGLVTSSSLVAISVITPNVAPTVTLTSPVNNASFNSPASVTINATAADTDGSVTKVEFYNGTTLLGSDVTSPYSFTWNNVAAGNYAITAKATDNGGLVTSSLSIAISVITPNVAPTVSLTSPVNNASFNAPASVTISATAADADGSVTKVDFYNGTTLLGSDATSPYSFTWNNMTAGNYAITAKATDNGGLVTSSSVVTMTAITPNVAPTVSVTSPVNSASFNAPASVTINATAADADGSVTKVDFYNGSTLLGSDATSPYSFTWNNVAAGNYAITAKATDNGGLVTSSSAVTITATTPNVAPTVSVTSPVNNASFNAPASVTISATAADADGSVTKVDFYNGSTLLGSDATSPYSFTWNNVAAGNYAITAKATDNGGLVTSSSAVTITATTPNVAPTVSVTSPASNASFNAPASVTINATAADGDGSVSKVEFYNGNTLLGSDATSPYSLTWNNVAAGNYAITAKATDNGGLVSSSTAITFAVVLPNAAPVVNITSPINNTSFNASGSITIEAAASDVDGSITSVDFYNGATFLGSDSTSPYSFTWNNIPAGNYIVTAKATDNSASTTSSPEVNLAVTMPNAAPVINITSPVTNTSFNDTTSVTIEASANDSDGSVTSVDFYNGNVLLGSDSTSPYSYTWNNVAPGNYTITAKATDNMAAVTSSSEVAMAVVLPNVAPTVIITSPVTHANFAATSTVTLTAIASDTDGFISKVEFYNGNTLITTEKKKPYSWAWKNVAEGSYTIIAKATDNSGLVTTSDSVFITVHSRKAPVVSITNPIIGSTYSGPSTVSINATASDSDGIVSKVEFFNGKTLIRTEYKVPYSYSWTNVQPGTYTLRAKATDNSGLVTTSDSISIIVTDATAAINSVANTTTTENITTTAISSNVQSNKKEQMSLKVGPNPASTILSVYTKGLPKEQYLKIYLMSLSGNVIKTINTKSANQVVQIDVSSLNSGVYIIKAVAGQSILLKQFVKW